jgi:hypothetical protein
MGRLGGRAPRQKGDRAERIVVRLLQALGLKAARVPLSGSAGGHFAGDAVVQLQGRALRIEIKCRGRGFKQTYDWIASTDVLVVKADRQELLAVLPLKLAIEISALAEQQFQEFPSVGRGGVPAKSGKQCDEEKSQ